MGLDLAAQLAELQKQLGQQNEVIQTALAHRDTGARAVPAGPPGFRRGENIMGSRGFSYGKCMMVASKRMKADDAKIEMDLCDRFTKCMERGGYRCQDAQSFLVPFWPESFNEDLVDNDLFMEIKSLIHAGTARADPEEVMWLRKRFGGGGAKAAPTPASPAMSWVDQSVGGALVGPPTFGSPIELLRNQETILKVAQIVPLGPTGQLTMPRMTGPTQGGWLGENTAQAPVNPTTGAVQLRAKKAFGIVVLPGELLRYGSPAAEAMVRNDLFKTCTLIVDKGFLDGQGGNNVPLGLVTAATATNNPHGFATVTLTTANTFSPQDPLKFVASVEANNGVFEGWMLRPELFYALLEVRATAYSGSGQVGQFVYNQFRALADGYEKRLNGYLAVTSAQVSKTRGNGSQTYVIGGQLSDYCAGLFGAVEMSQSDGGWTLFSSDQVAVRAIMSADGAPQHPGVWCVADAVNMTPGS